MDLFKEVWKPLLFSYTVYYFALHEVNSQTCITAGRIANPSVTDCSGYIFCVAQADGSFAQYNYTCPITSVFNPNSGKCTSSSNYNCPTTSIAPSSTTTTTVASTSTTTTTVAPTSTTITTVATSTAAAICTEEGFIANIASSDCSSFIMCLESDGVLSGTVEDCPTGTYYDPSTTLCESTYVCITTTAATTTTIPDTCTAAGYIPNTDVSGCNGYILYVLTGTDAYITYNYTCPTTSVLNPSTSLCTSSANYDCAT